VLCWVKIKELAVTRYADDVIIQAEPKLKSPILASIIEESNESDLSKECD
jgi:hypothetical protein